MSVSIPCTSSRVWARVVVLRLLGVNGLNVDNAWLKSESFLTGWYRFLTY